MVEMITKLNSCTLAVNDVPMMNAKTSIRNRQPLCLSVVAVVACLLCCASVGCSDRADSGQLARRRISSFRGANGLIGRSVIALPAGDCILFHYTPVVRPGEAELATQTDAALNAGVKSMLCLDDDVTENDGQIITPPDRWGGELTSKFTIGTFNCFSYVAGDLLDLHEGDWIEAEVEPRTNHTSPFGVVLSSFFSEIQRFDLKQIDWDELATSDDIQQDDLLVFANDYGDRLDYFHVGKAVQQDGRIMIEAKVGNGPIVRATLIAGSKLYLDKVDTLVIFRRSDGNRG